MSKINIKFSNGKELVLDVDLTAVKTAADYGTAVIHPAMAARKGDKRVTFEVGATPAGAPAGFTLARAAWEEHRKEQVAKWAAEAEEKAAKREAAKAARTERKKAAAAARRHKASYAGKGEKLAAAVKTQVDAPKVKFTEAHKRVVNALFTAVLKTAMKQATATVKAL